jgi:hypothetical protein
MPSTLDLQ